MDSMDPQHSVSILLCMRMTELAAIGDGYVQQEGTMAGCDPSTECRQTYCYTIDLSYCDYVL